MDEPEIHSSSSETPGESGPAAPFFSILIVNYNSGAERLSRCLASLAAQAAPRAFEIVLLDNGSDDGSAQVQSLPANARLIEAGENLGFAAGMNRAAAAARGQWLLLVNPDVVARRGWLAAMDAAIARYPGTAMFGSVQHDARNPDRLDGLGDVYHVSGIAWRGGYGGPAGLAPLQDEEIFAPCAAACAYRADMFARLGGFEESFFCYNEDVDFGFRARLAGENAVLVADAHVAHEGSAVTGRRSAFTVYHGTRNRIRTFIRCMPAPYFQAAFPLHVAMNLFFLLRAVPLGVVRPYWRGMIDGFFNAGPAWSARRRIQAGRTVSRKAVIDMMTFSLGKLLLRAPNSRVILQSADDPEEG